MKEAKLIAGDSVPSGFEIIINNQDSEAGKIWNLWWNVKLSDDPDSWDEEIKAINKMQEDLIELTRYQRLIRAQMAEFCRYHPSFPKSIEILCEEIGAGKFSKPVKMGCEGRGLLESLGYHDEESINEQVKAVLREYRASLGKWLSKGVPDCQIDSKVFSFLGEWTEGKLPLVEKICDAVDPEELNISSQMKHSENICNDAQGMSGMRPFNCFDCLPKDVVVPGCKCSYAMVIDAALLSIGESGKDKFKRHSEEHILAYCTAINSWLNDELPIDAGKQIHALLGEKNSAKEWLAACLLKTLKDNQRWHDGHELIDDFPEAVSWFKN